MQEHAGAPGSELGARILSFPFTDIILLSNPIIFVAATGCTSENANAAMLYLIGCCLLSSLYFPGCDTGRLILLEDASTKEALAASISDAYLNQASEQRPLWRDENGTYIFLPYSKLNPFR